MKIWKRNAVVLTVVLFVCVALYLSWSANRDNTVGSLDDYISSGSADDGTGAAAGDNAGAGAAATNDPLDGYSVNMPDGEDASDSAPVGDDVSLKSDTPESGYFAEMRLSRQKARDSALDILNQAADRKETDQSLRDQANAEIQNMAQAAMSEARIESLVIAKGFADCVAFLSGDSIDVLVATPEGGLLPSDVAKITDIIISETKLPVSGIHIVPAEV